MSVAVFLGFGVAVLKSPELFCVSVQPFAPRVMAFVLLGAGAEPAPLKQLAVFP